MNRFAIALLLVLTVVCAGCAENKTPSTLKTQAKPLATTVAPAAAHERTAMKPVISSEKEHGSKHSVGRQEPTKTEPARAPEPSKTPTVAQEPKAPKPAQTGEAATPAETNAPVKK